MVRGQRKNSVSIRALGAEWQLLAEILVTGVPEQKALAIEQVLEIVETFQLSAQNMEKMKTVVTRAVMNEIELIGHIHPGHGFRAGNRGPGKPGVIQSAWLGLLFDRKNDRGGLATRSSTLSEDRVISLPGK